MAGGRAPEGVSRVFNLLSSWTVRTLSSLPSHLTGFSDVTQPWPDAGGLRDDTRLGPKPTPATAAATPAPVSAPAGTDAEDDDAAPMIAAGMGGDTVMKHGKATTTLQRVAHYFRKRLI